MKSMITIALRLFTLSQTENMFTSFGLYEKCIAVTAIQTTCTNCLHSIGCGIHVGVKYQHTAQDYEVPIFKQN